MSFNSDMTNLANAIRSKAGVTGGLTVSALTTAVNGIVINTGSDIDLSGVNVTADKLLSGIVAVNDSGEKVTGNIATVTPSVSANVFTVRKGYVAQDAELTVQEAAALSVSGNVVTVPVGYIKTERTATIPEAAVTETDSSVTIGVGYVSEELTYDLGSDIDFTGVNVTANNLLEGIVAIGHDGGKVTGRMNYSTPRRDGSSVIVPQGYVDQPYTFEQMQVGYDTSEVTASFYNMLLGTIAVGPAGERIEGGIPTLTTNNIDLLNGGVVILGPGYVSGANLRYELPESTVTTTDTTLTATVGYLKEPINFTASGTGGSGSSTIEYGYINVDGKVQKLDLSGDAPVNTGDAETMAIHSFLTGQPEPDYGSGDSTGSGSGAFDLVKVTEYTPYVAEISSVTAVDVSGFGDWIYEEEPESSEYHSEANGRYVVTDATAGETDWKKRIYKHESKEYYLVYQYTPDNAESCTWFLCTSASTNDSIMWMYNYDSDTDDYVPSGDLTNRFGGKVTQGASIVSIMFACMLSHCSHV